MSSPTDLSNSNHVDHDFAFDLYDSYDLWPLRENGSIFFAIENYDEERNLDQNIIQQENFSVAEASINNPCSFLQEKSRVSSNYELNSCVLLEQIDSAVPEPVIDKGLLESSNSYYDYNNFSTTLETSENLCPSLEESSTSLCRKSYDTSGSLDPRSIIDQENSALEPQTHKGLEEAIIDNCNGNTLSNSIEASDNPWHLLEEGYASPLENNDTGVRFRSNAVPEEQISLDKRLNAKEKERSHRSKIFQTEEEMILPSSKQVSTSKKQEHNAKEKVRRMKFNANYLTLGALVPDFQRKKKRSASAIMDRAIEYIPELENEIEKLILKKNTLTSTTENERNISQSSQLEHQPPTVSVNEVKKGEVIIQIICITKVEDTVFTTLLQKVEAEGMSIVSASTLQVCEERVSYHLHMQMNGKSLAADYLAVFREKVISWLR